jgi:sulfoxide reductase heme-binding subunit YedZ
MTLPADEKFWWYLARSSGIVAWALLSATVVWGLLYASRMIPKRSAPKWLLDLHRFLGGFAVVFVVVHIAALVGDSYLYFGPREILVPFTGSWRPMAVGLGALSLYLLLAVEATSLAMRLLPRPLWRRVHRLSFPLFVLATAHTFMAGTDARNLLLVVLVAAATSVTLFAFSYRVLAAR